MEVKMLKIYQFKNIKILFFVAIICGSTSMAMPPSCPICYEYPDSSELGRFSCGHEYCLNCVSALIEYGIKGRENPRCPNPLCRKYLTREDFEPLLLADRIMQKLTYLEIAKNPNSMLCPTHSCIFAFVNDSVEVKIIQCPECHQNYCCQCLRLHDSKISCKKAERMEEDRAHKALKPEETASADWVSRNSRPCPKCSTPLFKDGGCNKVTCPKCGRKVVFNSEKKP
jgi:ariadne-1